VGYFTEEQQKDLAEKLGLNEQALTDFQKEENNTKENFGSLFENHKTAYSAQVREIAAKDTSFTKPFFDDGHKAGEGKYRGKVRHELAKHLTTEQLQDENGNETPHHLLIQQLVELLSKDDGKGDEKLLEKFKALQGELVTANKSNGEFQEQIRGFEESHIPKTELNGFKVNSALGSLLGGMKEKLIIDPDHIRPVLLTRIREDYQVSTNETGKLVFLNLDGSEPLNEKKDAKLTSEQITEKYLEPYIKKASDTPPATPPGGKPIVPVSDGNIVRTDTPYMTKLKEQAGIQ